MMKEGRGEEGDDEGGEGGKREVMRDGRGEGGDDEKGERGRREMMKEGRVEKGGRWWRKKKK